jgi:hypothetical protein
MWTGLVWQITIYSCFVFVNLKQEEDSKECGQKISLDKLQRIIDGWYLLQIYISIPFTN